MNSDSSRPNQPTGEASYAIADDLLMIPVPGHTRGSSCLLLDQKILFTGDHLAWSIPLGRLAAFSAFCWFDWPTQIESMDRLSGYDFEHVLPGHGAPYKGDLSAMREQLQACIGGMKTAPGSA